METEPRRHGRGSPTLVVAGAVCQGGKVLIQQRAAGKPGAGSWEFPGGKIEPGETPDEALRREMEEELGIVVNDAQPISFATDAHLVLLLFDCASWTGRLDTKEGEIVKWLAPAELEQHEMLTLDQELVLPLREFMMGL